MTAQQQAALDYLRSRRRYPRTDTARWVALGGLSAHLGKPRQGVSRTMASLVRRGLVERDVAGGVTFYRATEWSA